MTEFLKFFNEKRRSYPMHLEIAYSKICDWSIWIYRKGCAKDGSDLQLVCVQDADMELAFAKAYVELKEWLLEYEGGY